MSIALVRPRAKRQGFALRAIELLLSWQDIRRQRRHLAALPDHLLQDIGLSQADVARELSKPFWKI